MKIIMSTRAHNYIYSIFKYISINSLKYASITSEMLYSRINILEVFPYIGRYVPESKDKNYRELLYKSYRIIYSISEEINSIYIHSIIHCKRNLKLFLNSNNLK